MSTAAVIFRHGGVWVSPAAELEERQRSEDLRPSAAQHHGDTLNEMGLTGVINLELLYTFKTYWQHY